jgi:hypothetical protein
MLPDFASQALKARNTPARADGPGIDEQKNFHKPCMGEIHVAHLSNISHHI